MGLSQGCGVGGAELVTFLPPDSELWPLLCREQHCHGVTMFLIVCSHVWSLLLDIRLLDLKQSINQSINPQHLFAVLFLCSGGW